MKEYINKKPEYYDDFHCIGVTCTVSCCCDWGYISWDNAEYDKLMSAQISDELRGRLNIAFKRFENPDTKIEYWNIREIKDKTTGHCKCPLLTDDGWCSIQKEIGAEYLSYTCMTFPRLSVSNKGTITRNCSGACPEVLKILLNERGAMRLNEKLKKDDLRKVLCNTVDNNETIYKKPFLEYRNIIIELFYSLISDEKYSPETGLVLGAIAAKRISELADNKEYGKIPSDIRLLKERLGDESQIAQIVGIKPNYKIKLGVMGEVFMTVSSGIGVQNVIRNLTDEENMLVVDKYEQAIQELSDTVGDRIWFFRNLYLNTLLELNTMYFGRVNSIYDFWLYYCACCSMLKLTAASSVLNARDPERSMIDLTASFYRQIGHVLDMTDKVLDILKEHKCTTPAYIALMLK